MTDHQDEAGEDVVDLNVSDLDIEQLEQRLELAAAHLDEAFLDCTTCPNLGDCGTFTGNCGALLGCGTFQTCKPTE